MTSVYRVVKYDGMFQHTVCYTFSNETGMSQIEKDIGDYCVSYPNSRVKRIWDRNPPIAVLTIYDERGFVREWQYSIIKLRVLE